ncbi:Uncharacterized protein DBV15_12484 [Temnothorax longispinosus]|uniref:Uncharacterized protein n=1 Tax=Temnothorax longispinosus TaxID=300112 RepID=A0A4S2L4G5_9HYME|nr:Uncharacterized protein DBV15_12484 [Temnothorax longispinosus]
MLPRRFKEARAEFIVSVATKREEREREREEGGKDVREKGGEKDAVVILPPDAIPPRWRKRRLDGSRDKLRRDLATTGIDPPKAESRVLPSESGRLFVYPRVTVESIDRDDCARRNRSRSRSIDSRKFHHFVI